MADGWRAVEEEWLGGWLLRASSGFTSRGNSVLPLGDPGLPLERGRRPSAAWYAARRLPPPFQLVLPPSGRRGGRPARRAAGARGYRVVQPTLVMTGATSDIDPLRDGRRAGDRRGDPVPRVARGVRPSAPGRARRHRAGAHRLGGPARSCRAGRSGESPRWPGCRSTPAGPVSPPSGSTRTSAAAASAAPSCRRVATLARQHAAGRRCSSRSRPATSRRSASTRARLPHAPRLRLPHALTGRSSGGRGWCR